MTCVSPVPTRYLVTTNKKCNNNTRTEITPFAFHIYIVYTLLVTKEERKMVRILHRTAVKAILTVQRFQQHTLTLFHSSLHHSFIRHPARRVRRKPWRLPKRSRPPRTRCSHPDHVLSKLVVTFVPLDVIYRDSSNGPNTFASNVNVRSCTND